MHIVLTRRILSICELTRNQIRGKVNFGKFVPHALESTTMKIGPQNISFQQFDKNFTINFPPNSL